MNDEPISRQAAFKGLEDLNIASFYEDNEDSKEVYTGVKAMLKALPSAQPGWIPTSERLPEDAYPVIVTWKNNDPKSYYQYILGKHYTGVAHF